MQLANVHLGTINHTFSGSDITSALEKPGHLVKPFTVIYQSALAMSHYRQPNTYLRSEVAWYESSVKASVYLHKHSGMPIKHNSWKEHGEDGTWNSWRSIVNKPDCDSTFLSSSTRASSRCLGCWLDSMLSLKLGEMKPSQVRHAARDLASEALRSASTSTGATVKEW